MPHTGNLVHTGPSLQVKSKKTKERERVAQKYYFAGQQVCRDTFLFCHGIGKFKLNSIAASLDKDGLKPRIHGNTGKTPKHALSLTDVQRISQFLKEYTLKNGLPLPGRQPNYSTRGDKVLLLLPSDKTKSDIWELYNQAATMLNYRQVSLSEFKKVWLEQTPHILIMKPATDLCPKCQRYVHNISNAGNLSEEEKKSMLDEYTCHLDKAKQQREYYRERCLLSKELFQTHDLNQTERGQVCTMDMTQMYSFDFAQQIHYPHHAQEVGPLFFKTPRKCQAFGVCAEGAGEQVFYLVDEAEEVGKGANTVVSLLHHFFEHWGYGEKDAVLQMDNCAGQNKNNTMIRYGMWRIMTGRHRSIEFSLMEAGHTKFSPDWHFGLWKMKWRHSTAETLDEVAESVRRSSRNGHNIPQLINDAERPVSFYDWTSFFEAFFKKLPSISKFHHFRMSEESPGVVFVKAYRSSAEKPINILKKGQQLPNVDTLPSVITPKGLDAARQWYLYDEIRPFCRDTSDSLQSCPKPVCPKPRVKIDPEKRKCPKQFASPEM